MSGMPFKLVVGLGNPGPTYAHTRHNAGFAFIDELARRTNVTLRAESRHHGVLGRARIGAHEVWLLKPMTYMNLSGDAVRSVAAFYKIEPDAVLVAHDELDFAPGVVRLKHGGGAGGHNGLRDIMGKFGESFWRLRIGIGHPGDRAIVLGYVLGRPFADEAELIEEAICAAADAMPVMLADGAQKAMNQLHSRASGARPDRTD